MAALAYLGRAYAVARCLAPRTDPRTLSSPPGEVVHRVCLAGEPLVLVTHTTEPPPLYPLRLVNGLWLALWRAE